MKIKEIESLNFFICVDSTISFVETEKWDNHNAIARGWRTIEDSYHPVTFRRIYGIGKQQQQGSLKNTASAPQLASSPLSYQCDDTDEQKIHNEVFDTERDL